MFDEEQICPYTGLRPFTEDESLYFKGREEDVDQATEQLQRNKFLMLTGASGDGKSSLIYAGIIPNARAGFLKAKYTNWCVADFRPERSPFHNLCQAIGRELDIPNLDTVQAELNHGFSAVVDLYKNSKRYADTGSVDWQTADDAGKAALRREAANLLILVDQFEEFFTNPENYHKGVPSGSANLVLNLLLETARIALEEDLPIYIVFTMRSDYIGQCAAFRGLPESIGFSQFFVPRLNRTQLQQVVEEPAVLSGNRITRRLTERLIHDLTEGVDQLPILQHALNQIWHAADSGREEMDLIHYAMVGGMPFPELPEEQVDRFNEWFSQLAPNIQACYHKPSLQNVLDTHTNKLYEQAASYYTAQTGKPITDEDARQIVKTVFTCLTKIDQSRAVRNRMTLAEITQILGKPEYKSTDVASVLNIFREPGNTFIRPFIIDPNESRQLDDDTVLDITHESLIRNWAYLEQWAKEEFDNYTVSIDFKKQLSRWVESGKSRGFLLPIGPLTYFENWFNQARPNVYWIARYEPDDAGDASKLSKSTEILNDSHEFLKKSAARHRITRTIMRYGPRRIAMVLGIITILIFSSFAVRKYLHTRNDYVLGQIGSDVAAISNDSKLSPEFTVPIFCQEIILGKTSIPEIIGKISDPHQKARIATGIAAELIMSGRNEPAGPIKEALLLTDSLLTTLAPPANTGASADYMKLVHNFNIASGYAYYFDQNDTFRKLADNNAKRAAQIAMDILRTQPEEFTGIPALTLMLEAGINHHAFSSNEIAEIIEILSPFGKDGNSEWVKGNFGRDQILVRGPVGYGLPFNGLYQELAYLYAALGRSGMVNRCTDSILKYQSGFFNGDYATVADNASNIAAVYYTYGFTDSMRAFVNYYCRAKRTGPIDFYFRLVARATLQPFQAADFGFYSGGGGQVFYNPNITLSPDSMMIFFFDRIKEEASRLPDMDERNFTLAMALKNEGCLLGMRNSLRRQSFIGNDTYFEEAIGYYRQVSHSYLDAMVSIVGSAGSDNISVNRKYQFLYPDFRVAFHPYEPRTVMQFYFSSSFLKYILNKGHFHELYQAGTDFRAIENWLFDAEVVSSNAELFLRKPIPGEVLQELAKNVEKEKANRNADFNILYWQLGDWHFRNGRPEAGIAALEQIQPEKLLNAFLYSNYDFVNSYSLKLVADAMAELTANNRFELAYSFLDVFKKQVNRSSLYGYASQEASRRKLPVEAAVRLLDSARAEMRRIDNPALFQPNRHQVAIAMVWIDPEKNIEEAYQVIKNSQNKEAAIANFGMALAAKGKLYEAVRLIPPLFSRIDKSFNYLKIHQGFNSMHRISEEWQSYYAAEPTLIYVFLPYINENS